MKQEPKYRIGEIKMFINTTTEGCLIFQKPVKIINIAKDYILNPSYTTDIGWQVPEIDLI